VRTAIDRYRTEIKKTQLITSQEIPEQSMRMDFQILDKIEIEEKIKLIQKLSPAYRTVFNLYVFEQYTHEEIAALLNISEGTSKSNLAKARQQLKQLFTQFSFID
jgi:RNA polymerase sigma-70 factor (ECF subfamily)